MSSTPLLRYQHKDRLYNESTDNNDVSHYDSENISDQRSNKYASNDKEVAVDSISHKLDTLEGVTLPTILNVLSILMFLRFGFIIGQMGVIGTIGLLLMSYGIDLLTTLSVSAIATNGTVKGGGAYYMLSRSLGVEFGGAIGVIFFIGQVLNSSMNVAGVIEPLMYNFSSSNGAVANILPEGYWWQFGYCTLFLFLCIIVSLIGSNAVSKAGTYLCIILLFSTLTVPISALIVGSFETEYNITYTGISWENLKNNLWPHFTKGAAGSQLHSKETFNDLFGIFFPATAGIFAGASMSGDLKNPSKSIPKGTLDGLWITFTCYLLVIISIGASIPRELLYKDIQVLQTVNMSPYIILAGEMSTSIFSIVVGIVGAAKLLQAIARDEILPGLGIFGNGDKKSDDPKEAILFTWIICQLFLFADLNQIATFITMAFLMTFIVTNLACALLKLGSAPNFRPSFKYFSTNSALAGSISCFVAMFIVDGITASLIFITLMFLILVIHFVSPPKQWGDVSQSLIYHQVRKYLLKLRQDNVKYWRPQILLLVDNPRTAWKLISFCNHLKKGGLYVLGHVFVTSQFQSKANDLSKARESWVKIRDISNVKAFVQTSIAPTFAWGVRNIFLGSGLGGMRPNITIVGFYNLEKYKGKISLPDELGIESLKPGFRDQVKFTKNLKSELKSKSKSSINGINSMARSQRSSKPLIINEAFNNLPTDDYSIFSSKMKITEWVSILEDLSLLGSNVAVAKGFPRLEIPVMDNKEVNDVKRYIDLYPIQMVGSTNDSNIDGAKQQHSSNLLATNFDTCTLILQLGAILSTVPCWHNYTIRVIVFVEDPEDVEIERERIQSLLEILRMQADVVVLCLSCGELGVYEMITRGDDSNLKEEEKIFVNSVLKEDEWWQEVSEIRLKGKVDNTIDNSNYKVSLNKANINKYSTAVGSSNWDKRQRRMTVSRVNQLGMKLGMGMVVNNFRHEFSKSIENDDDSASDVDSLRSSSSFRMNKQPGLSHMKSTNSVRKMGKSTFTAQKMPQSKILDDAVGNEPSIVFSNDQEQKNDQEKDINQNKISCEDHREGKVKKDSDTADENFVKTSLSSVNSNNNQRKKKLLQPNSDPLSPKLSHKTVQDTTIDNSDEEYEVDEFAKPGFVVKFADMTRRCQFLIINEMMRKVSAIENTHTAGSRSKLYSMLNHKPGAISSINGKGETKLIFTTLPTPEVGLHYNEVDCVDYVVDLALWMKDLPPMLLINSKTVTVTSNL